MKKFPETFRFGIADADLQVIGEKHTRENENSLRTMWHQFAEMSGKCHQNESPEFGVDRYHHFEDDAKLIQNLGVSSYRTSISMSRLLNEKMEPNPKAIAWYRGYFSKLKELGIDIAATLYHWELPLIAHENGGWKNRDTCEWLVKHGEVAAREFGDLVSEFFILNEPWCAAMLSYHQGCHAPGETDLKGALQAAHHLLLAQAQTFRAMKRVSADLALSTVFNVETAYAASSNDADLYAARCADGYFNRWFWDPLFKGSYPEDMLELYGEAANTIEMADLAEIQIGSELTTMGVNYYCGKVLEFNPNVDERHKYVWLDGGETNDLGWPICVPPTYGEGFYDILQQLYFDYRSFGLKNIAITENGIALKTPWDGKSEEVKDERRVKYFTEHLGQVLKAISRGIPIRAYYAWTLMDNYEWAEGYRPESCFGLVHVDRESMRRIPKQSYAWYRKVATEKKLP